MKNIALGTHFQGLNRQYSFKGLLDIYGGAAAAYSLRKLSKATTSVVRVRRDSDNAEQDFTALEITDGTLEAWVNTQVERTTNGDFDTDTDWTKGTGWSIADGKASSDGSQTTASSLFQGGLAIGQTHNFTMTVTDYVSGSVLLRNGIGGAETYISAKFANGTYTATAVVDGGGTNSTLVISASADFVGSVSFVSAIQTTSDGLVTTWYDQSGNGNDATQGTASSQPKIVDTGVLVRENGEPALEFDGTDDSFVSPTFTVISQPITKVVIAQQDVDNFGYLVDGSTTQRGVVGTDSGSNKHRLFAGHINDYVLENNGLQLLRFALFDGTLSQLFLNGLALGVKNVGADGLSGVTIGRHSTTLNQFARADIQEIVIYPTDQSTNRSGIEANINKAFNIYWDGTQKGLLDTYTGAEAAYSLRALNSAYTGAILRVRRDSDNAEQDIYAKWDGTLNVEALETFCAATDGYVATWYDQSGNSNNATQATAASQPQIVSSGSIITDSGYQFIKYDGTDDNLGTSFTATGTMLMGGADGGAFYEVAVSGSYNLLESPSLTDHPLKESIRVIWSRTLSAGEQSVIESRVTYSDWDFSDVTNFYRYWRSRSELTSFPLLDVSSGTNFISTWQNCSSLTSFPLLDVSSGTNFGQAWISCSSLTSFPLLDFSSGTNFSYAWLDCSSLQDFPANMFDSCTATLFTGAFSNTNLTQTSIDNILVSLDTAGQSGGTFDQSGGSAPSATGEAAIDSLVAKGWTISVTGVYDTLSSFVYRVETDGGIVEDEANLRQVLTDLNI